MSRYGYLKVFQIVRFEFEITRLDCIYKPEQTHIRLPLKGQFDQRVCFANWPESFFFFFSKNKKSISSQME